MDTHYLTTAKCMTIATATSELTDWECATLLQEQRILLHLHHGNNHCITNPHSASQASSTTLTA
jgi:hypothetical protein